MISVDQPMLFDANRFSIISQAGGKFVPRQKVSGHVPHQMALIIEHVSDPAAIKEWKTESGEVIARKVEACGSTECWLRQDLALAVLVARANEAAEYESAVKKVLDWRDKFDAENAAKRNMTVEAYRKLRNAQGHRQVMKSGVNSIGMR